jgi:hypothetical protein
MCARRSRTPGAARLLAPGNDLHLTGRDVLWSGFKFATMPIGA